MPFCPHCGAQLTSIDKFCSKCGKPAASRSRLPIHPPLYFSISLILVVVILLVIYSLPSQKKESENKASANAHLMTEATQSTIMPDGKLNYQKEVYVIITGSYLKMKYVQLEMEKLRELGEQTGYFWRPEFPALQNEQIYSTFVGMYDTYEECERALRKRQVEHPDYYGLRLNMNPEKVTIH